MRRRTPGRVRAEEVSSSSDGEDIRQNDSSDAEKCYKIEHIRAALKHSRSQQHILDFSALGRLQVIEEWPTSGRTQNEPVNKIVASLKAQGTWL